MKYPVGTWKGLETTIPSYPVTSDVVVFSPEGAVHYSTVGPKGEKWNVRFETTAEENEILMYPLSDLGIRQTEEPLRIQVAWLSPDRICITRLGHRTIYQRSEN